jgi:hypothetical protein
LEIVWKEAVVTSFDVVFWYLPGETEKNDGKLQRG